MTQHFPGLMSQYLVLAHFLLNRETRWDVGIPGVYIAFSALGGRLQSSHCQTTAHQQENNTSRDQCECTYTQHTDRQHMLTCWHTNLIWHTETYWKTPGLHSTTQHCTCLMCCFMPLCLWHFVSCKSLTEKGINVSSFYYVIVTVWETRDDSTWRSSPRHWERSHATTKGDVQDQVFW